MSTKADFTEAQWELLCAGPALAGIGVMVLDASLVSDVPELAAIAQKTSDGQARHGDNPLVQAILAELGRHDAKHIGPEGTTAEEVLTKLVAIDAILDAACEPGEALVYRNFLFDVADAAAQAWGGFFGLGERVSDEERAYLGKLKDILFRAAPSGAPAA